MRPRIGLTSDMRTEKRTIAFAFDSYYQSVERAGGLPLIIPPMDPDRIPQLLDELDGLVFVGGEDIHPKHYGEVPLPSYNPLPSAREEFDLALAKALLDHSLPVLAVCFGCQVLAVVSGGALTQDIATQIGDDISHAGSFPELPHHDIDVVPNTRTHAILGCERLRVNSAHHQAPKRLGAGLVLSATAADGVIEAFEAEGDRFLVAVEWHPDLMPDHPEQMRLFEALVEAAMDSAGKGR